MIYPESLYCICCGNIVDKTRSYSLCDHCNGHIRWAEAKTCKKCGKLLEESYENELCTNCLENQHLFEKGFTCSEYGLYQRTVTFNFKYNGKTYISRDMAKAMNDRMALEDVIFDYVVPVPMFKDKENRR